MNWSTWFTIPPFKTWFSCMFILSTLSFLQSDNMRALVCSCLNDNVISSATSIEMDLHWRMQSKGLSNYVIACTRFTQSHCNQSCEWDYKEWLISFELFMPLSVQYAYFPILDIFNLQQTKWSSARNCRCQFCIGWTHYRFEYCGQFDNCHIRFSDLSISHAKDKARRAYVWLFGLFLCSLT